MLEPSAINYSELVSQFFYRVCVYIYLGEILAAELRDQGREAIIIGFDSNGVEDLLDVLRGRGAVAAEGEEEVSCEVLHCECCREKLSASVVKKRLKT